MDHRANGAESYLPSHHADALERAMKAERESFGVIERAMSAYVRDLSGRGVHALRVPMLIRELVRRARGSLIDDDRIFTRSLDAMVHRCVAKEYRKI
jgi:hypothetical protein